MTPAELLRELALIALVMVAWTTLVMLMLERDRKRAERRALHDEVSDEVATGRTENPAPCSSSNEKSALAGAPQGRTDA